jgi:CMP-N,N'-diacetyllegionaminic acid synthase
MNETRRPEILALIPARGGSKGILRKNLVPLLGKPLIGYTIEQALASRLITRTIVSTDDDEIAAVSRQFKADVPFMRPAEFAQDRSLDFEVFWHALNWLKEHEAYNCDLVVHLRPTGPVRRLDLIDEAISLMLAHPEADALRSVSTPTQTPYKMWSIENGYLNPLLSVEGMKEPYCLPRQVLPPVYWQNGYIDIIRPATILEQRLMAGKTILPFVTREPILEIDYGDSLPLVEEALRKLQAGESSDLSAETRHAA